MRIQPIAALLVLASCTTTYRAPSTVLREVHENSRPALVPVETESGGIAWVRADDVVALGPLGPDHAWVEVRNPRKSLLLGGALAGGMGLLVLTASTFSVGNPFYATTGEQAVLVTGSVLLIGGVGSMVASLWTEARSR